MTSFVDWNWRCAMIFVRWSLSDNLTFSWAHSFLGFEECTQGGTKLPRVETAELSWPEALAVPRAEHTAHDGPRRTGITESRLTRKRGRELQKGCTGKWGQQLNRIKGCWPRGNDWEDGLYTWTSEVSAMSSWYSQMVFWFSKILCLLGWARA